MAPRRTQGAQRRPDHACCAAFRPSRSRREARGAGSREGVRVLSAAVVGLLCSSTAPTPVSAFLVPGGVIPPSRRSVGGGSSAGFRGRRAVGVSSLQSSFAGSSCFARLAQHRGSSSSRRSRVGAGAGGLRMGIPKLFRWLTDQYPVISQRLDQGLNEVRFVF